MAFSKLSGLAAGFGRGVQALGSFGLSELQRQQTRRKREELQQLGNILSGQSIPAFARPGGAEPLTPEAFRQTQQAQLGRLGTPEAIQALTALDPRLRGGQTDLPASVREFLFTEGLPSEEQKRFLNLKRADPLRAKGLMETPQGVQMMLNFAESLQAIERAKETGAQQARTEFEPAREAQKTEAQKRAALRVDLEAAFPTLQTSFETKTSKTDNLIEQIDRVLPEVSGLTAGFASLLDVIPGTPQADLAANIDTILANVGFQELQAMRDSSPTGGALGQVSERENLLLQSTLANIRNSQSPSQLRKNLNLLKKRLREGDRRLRRAFDRDAKRIDIDVNQLERQEGDLTTLSTEELLRMLNE